MKILLKGIWLSQYFFITDQNDFKNCRVESYQLLLSVGQPVVLLLISCCQDWYIEAMVTEQNSPPIFKICQLIFFLSVSQKKNRHQESKGNNAISLHLREVQIQYTLRCVTYSQRCCCKIIATRVTHPIYLVFKTIICIRQFYPY